MNWVHVAIFTPAFFVAFQALSKLLPKDISIFLVNAYASLVGLVSMLIIHFLTSPDKSIHLSAKYAPIAIGIGILISLGNYFIIKAFSLGAPQTMFTAIFNPLYIVYGVLVGLIIWHEKLNLIQASGILLSIAGIVITVYFKKA